MTLAERVRAIPIYLRVPILVAALMLAISAAISERVFDRLASMQESYIRGLAETYFDGLSSSLVPAVLREDVWEVFDSLDRSSSLYAAIHPAETVVTDAHGRVLASSNPRKVPSYVTLPESYREKYGRMLRIDSGAPEGFAKRNLVYQGHHIGTIYSTFDVSSFLAERADVLFTLVLTNGMLAAVFAFLGFLVVRHMIRPMRTLEEHMRRTADGTPAPIGTNLIPRNDGEVAKLFRGYNALVEAQETRAVLSMKLAEEERLASLGRLASGMAHEINNPLGGLFNALDTLKSHGDTRSVRNTSISLIERGLEGIKDVAGAALATYRPERSPHPFSRDDIEDVRLLIGPELRRKQQRLDCKIAWPETAHPSIPGGPLRQAMLNLLLNACAATPEHGTVLLRAEVGEWSLTVAVGDQGEGMPKEVAHLLEGSAEPSDVKNSRGLGLWMVRQVMEDLGGDVRVEAAQDAGTVVRFRVAEQGRKETANAA